MVAGPEATRRLFFAFWPSAGTRRAVSEAVAPVLAACGGRPVAAAHLHITLAFLGAVPDSGLHRVEAAAARLRSPPLVLPLDTLEHWRKPQVVVAVPASPPADAAACAAALWELLAPLGFEADRRPYLPHLTLARKVRQLPPGGLPALVAPLLWQAQDFVLVDSVTLPEGPQYRVIGRWPLAGH